MSKLEEFQARARYLAQSGMFYGLPPLEFELRFENGYEEAEDWLADPAVRDELEFLCREARISGVRNKKATSKAA